MKDIIIKMNGFDPLTHNRNHIFKYKFLYNIICKDYVRITKEIYQFLSKWK